MEICTKPLPTTSKTFGNQKLIVVLTFLVSTIGYTQKSSEDFLINIDLHVNLKNMHTWHGYVVTPGAMVAGSVDAGFLKDKVRIGVWGGSSFNGDYTELSYFLNYKLNPKTTLSLISHNNYSGWQYPNIFSWNRYRSPNFLDIVVETLISKKFPLNIYFSTILLGQGGDYEVEADIAFIDSYSNYLELKYPVVGNENLNISVFAGGAFSFFTKKTFTVSSPTW